MENNKTKPNTNNNQLEAKWLNADKTQDIAEWYSQLVVKSELADYAPVSGCMIIRPYGYKIWQNIQRYFDQRLVEQGVENAYFPLFIPESFFKKEAEHAKGFSPEVAWIEKKDEKEERLALRPTSETIMYDAYSRWIRSWRDLPIKINQWCNIVRWETKDVKLFLRSREFLWQEGHCAYATMEENHKEVLLFLEEYRKLIEEQLAIAVIAGEKTPRERFAGALHTYTLEAFMPDYRALQLATTHDLGQNFAKAFNIKFLGKDEQEHYVWQSSWGFSTRLIGALVMVHGDNLGLILPPRIAPIQVIIVPIWFSEQDKAMILKKSKQILTLLTSHNIRAKLDDRDGIKPGRKFYEWEFKGVPLRIELGPEDIKHKTLTLVRRDLHNNDNRKQLLSLQLLDDKKLVNEINNLLNKIQDNLYQRSKEFLKTHLISVTEWQDFVKEVKQNMVMAPHCGDPECEQSIQQELPGVTSRVIPFEQPPLNNHKCIKCGKEAKYWVYFSKAY